LALTGIFEKEVSALSRQIERLFEEVRVDYLSAKQDPKAYSKDWGKRVDKVKDAYSDIDDLSRTLQNKITEKTLESSDVNDPNSRSAKEIYEAIKSLRFDAKYVKDPFTKKFDDSVLDKLLEDKVIFALFIHWAIRTDKRALSINFWESHAPKGDVITDGYAGLDLHLEDIPSYIIEHYGEGKETKAVKPKFKGALALLKDLYVKFYSEGEWDELVGIDISKADTSEKENIDFLVPNKPMYRIFDIDDINELKGFTGEWVVQEKYDGMRVQLHKLDKKITVYSYNGKDISDRCDKAISVLKENKFGECILDAELMLFDGDKPLPRADAIARVFKDVKSDAVIKIHVFDIMRHNERDLLDVPLEERLQILMQNYSPHSHEFLAFPSKQDTRIADSLEEIEEYAKEIMEIPTSEGVVIKDLTSTYFKGTKKNPKWIKWKKFIDLDLIVLDKKTTKSNLNSYTLGAGPLLIEESRKIDSKKINDRYYMDVGKALNTKVNVEVGSIVRVKVDEVKENKQGQIRIFSAKVIEIPEVESPDKVITLELLAGEKDISNYKVKALEKSFSITDEIHGETEIILKSDFNGFTIYGFNENNLMAKNAILDIDIWKEQIEGIMKAKKGYLRVFIKNIIQEEEDNKLTLEKIIERILKDPKASKIYEEIFNSNSKKLSKYLTNQAEEIIFEGGNIYSANEEIIEKGEYKTPEEYREGEFKLYKREDGNLSLTFLLKDEKLGWEIKIEKDDDIFDLFGKAGKYPAKVQTTVSRDKLVDEGKVTLGVQRHGYHEYFLKGDKFDTKLHLRVVPIDEEKKWIAFTSFVEEPVKPSTDDGIWDFREEENKDLSFEGLA
tara:strand:+ start:103 stop:2625 length:2523 start_codon:yes stop_codon:yes gene_type:complete